MEKNIGRTGLLKAEDMLETKTCFSEQFEEWTLDDDTLLPTRSELYHMQPAGLGTSFIESLTSYIARLADSHCLTTGAWSFRNASRLWAGLTYQGRGATIVSQLFGKIPQR